MRRFFVLLFAIGVAAASGCSNDNNPVQSTTCSYTLSSTAQSAGAEGGQLSINVTRSSGSCGWTAQSDASWITVSNTSGADTSALGYSVAANTGTDARTGHVTVSWTGGSSQVTVTQAGAPASSGGCTYSVNPVAVTAPAEGATGQATVTVTGTNNCNWSAQSNQFWIHITSATPGPATGTISYTVDANTGPQRFGRIVVTHTAGTTDISFTQNAPCPVSLNPTTQSVGNSGGAFTTAFTTAAGCTWTAASDAPWLTISSATSGTGDATIGYAVAANTGAARTGHVTVTAGNNSAQVTVNQSGTGTLTASFTVAPIPCPVTATGSGTNLMSCTFDASGSTGSGINSYVFRLVSVTGPIVASGTNAVVTNPTLACGQGGLTGSGNVDVDVFLTITSPSGSSTTTKSVTFARSAGC
jgi:Putative binding domain, N-terminal/Viral BACON domain